MGFSDWSVVFSHVASSDHFISTGISRFLHRRMGLLVPGRGAGWHFLCPLRTKHRVQTRNDSFPTTEGANPCQSSLTPKPVGSILPTLPLDSLSWSACWPWGGWSFKTFENMRPPARSPGAGRTSIHLHCLRSASRWPMAENRSMRIRSGTGTNLFRTKIHPTSYGQTTNAATEEQNGVVD